LWAKYPTNHQEKKWAGACLWYRTQLPDSAVWEKRECPEFFEAIPGWDSAQHWSYATRHDDLGRSWRASRRAVIFSIVSLVLSAVGLSIKFF